jgi:hypothetical protein
MTEAKHCWQTEFLPEPMSCFIRAGAIPCEAEGCLVSNAINNPVVSDDINLLDVVLLCHFQCRISNLSENNGEYLKRIQVSE